MPRLEYVNYEDLWSLEPHGDGYALLVRSWELGAIAWLEVTREQIAALIWGASRLAPSETAPNDSPDSSVRR